MTTSHTSAGSAPWRSPSLPTLFGAVVAGGALVLAAAWPAGEGPSVLSAASADTPAVPAQAAAMPAAPQGTSVPDAASVFVGHETTPEEPMATF